MNQKEKHARFAALHQRQEFLVLPNAWDAASARIFEAAGFPAVATTSAGVAFSLGYADGEKISREEMMEVVARVARSVALPVSADVEAGYGDPVATAKAVAAAGAVGMNLEDALPETPDRLRDTAEQAAAIRAIRALDLPVFINARTDILLANIGDPATQLARTVERLNAYRDAGADCLFAPGARDAATIAELVREVKGPLNILGGAGVPDAPALRRLGVSRVSIGSGACRATLGLVQRIADELFTRGTYGSMLEGQMGYEQANRLLGGR